MLSLRPPALPRLAPAPYLAILDSSLARGNCTEGDLVDAGYDAPLHPLLAVSFFSFFLFFFGFLTISSRFPHDFLTISTLYTRQYTILRRVLYSAS